VRFIDVHCHLEGDYFGDISGLIAKFDGVGVEKVITCGVHLKSSEQAHKLSQSFDNVYFTAGFHPTELKDYNELSLNAVARLADDKKCVAIGEIGLDYHYPDTDKVLQQQVFIAQLKLAYELRLPVEIRSRDAAEDTYNILKENAQLIKYGALMHCYSYSKEMSELFEKLGMYFSFGGMSTYSGSKRARKSIERISLKKLLTETDSPYLAPKSQQGVFPNTPLNIPEITANMAEIKGVCVEEMSDTIWCNAHELFGKL